VGNGGVAVRGSAGDIDESEVFPSKVDRWLLVVLAVAGLACVVAALAAGVAGGAVGWLLGGLILVLGTGLPFWVLGWTRYTLTASDLVVRSGPFRWQVPLNEIRTVVPTRSPLSSPALSLDRLRIDYGQSRWLMVSPKDREGFLRALDARRGAVAARGDR
jgi:hypothetical protein